MLHMTPTEPGWVEVISGCMYAGKSEEVIRRLRRCELAKQSVQAFKPATDTRHNGISSHNGVGFNAIPVTESSQILTLAPGLVQDAPVIGIDEAQFFDPGIVDVVQALASRGKRVIIAGLDMDYRGAPFGPMPGLLAIAEFVTKVHAICTVCGGMAPRTQRIVDSQERVLVGATSAYEARCRKHWSPDPVFARREMVGEMDG